ncbi:hypothetical protein GY21_10500 [Cryobacterium roopkundense]|uniref:Catechol 2,3-dioxygenase-like lactoylglutathione lyase family enzyme n=1 Tax=Cryobacterium roopkundense TaxID=1001240 RepID=A0A099JAF0_9MICO|nr:VOC family protein [Cryobacterium roopkundense]KGJ74467.1 hypothetical protein GY21_10500 [Cryobacterium roopkundense]MBB5643419.1 catechol 2,3-dioxygenase-like lactoylglutathione lyase family enzyme [Cryobacterium roopkundense]
MLKEIHPVLPAADLSRARSFYHDALDLEPVEVLDGLLVYSSPGSGFEIYETENAGTAKNTQMSFITDDLDGEMVRLRARGVVFEDYDIPGMKTVDGVAATDEMKSAWFRDTEGNFICVTELLR